MSDEKNLAVMRWAAGRDTGMSSMAIWSHMLTGEAQRDTFGVSVAHPHDPSDFGRCHRLLQLAGVGWQLRIAEMAQYSAEWAALAEHWDELTRLYLDGEANKTRDRWTDGHWRTMYNRMDALLTNARVCADCGKRGMSGWTTAPGDVKRCWECGEKAKAAGSSTVKVGNATIEVGR